MSQATPRPWRVIAAKVIGSETVRCATTEVYGGGSEFERRANAELIVKAVNRDHLFEGLVDTLEEANKAYCGPQDLKTKIQDILKLAKALK